MSAPAAAQAYAQGALPTAIQDGLADFLATYGHRAVAEIDLGMPRWRDDPTHLLGVLANYLQLDDPDLAPERQFADGARIAESAIDRIVASHPPLRVRPDRCGPPSSAWPWIGRGP